MNALLASLRTTWSNLSARERRALVVGALAAALALICLLLLAPALKVLRAAPEQNRLLDQQLSHQQGLRQEAQQLRATPGMVLTDAQVALQASVKAQLGPNSQITLSNDKAGVTLKGVSPAALAQWLAAARTGAQSKPVDAQLTQQNGNWEGTVLMQLPQGEAR